MADPVIIGDATLYLGDCLDLLPRLDPVDHVITDPPYEAAMQDRMNRGAGRKRNDGGPDLKALGFAPIDAIRAPFLLAVEPLCRGWLLAFCTSEGVARWADAIEETEMRYKRACVWVKPDSTPNLTGDGPAAGAECFVTAWAGDGRAQWNSGGKRGVYTHCVNTDRHGGHPTEKPVPLMAELLADFTQPGQVVLDPFMGSGTTGVACAKLGRKFIGIEIEPKYFDIACRRIEEAYRQPRLFAEPKPKAIQLDLEGAA